MSTIAKRTPLAFVLAMFGSCFAQEVIPDFYQAPGWIRTEAM
jgi:hypothetical protein